MNQGFGGLQCVGASGVFSVLSTGTLLSGTLITWAAIAATPHGEQSVSASTTTGYLTLVPGTYKVDIDLSLENAAVSGLSSEDVTVQEVVSVELVQPDETTGGEQVIAGTKSLTEIMEGLVQHVHVSCIVEITKTMLDDAENKIAIYLKSALAGDTGIDLMIREARFLAVRID